MLANAIPKSQRSRALTNPQGNGGWEEAGRVNMHAIRGHVPSALGKDDQEDLNTKLL